MAIKHKYIIEKEVWINDEDPDLVPIHVDIVDLISRIFESYGLTPPNKLPKPENVPGYDLPHDQQVFQREVTPRKLITLEKKLRSQPRLKAESFIHRELGIINQFWAELNEKRDEYKEEIRWLRKIWTYRLLGKWFWCNGVLTWMPGTAFYYLNNWYLDTVLPDYRDRDRRWWIAQAYALHETRTFAHIDPHTHKAIDPETGKPAKGGKRIIFDLIETGGRVIFGTNNAKSRRVGDTSKAECESEEVGSRTNEARLGIQGKDDTNAKKVFVNHLVKPFKKKSIFLKPLFRQLDPKKEHLLDSDDPELGLQTIFDYATSADRSAYDGDKLLRYHGDEPGKVKFEDVTLRHSVVKECLRLGSDINGFMKYTTTVDEMNRRGGEKYLILTQDSHFNIRNELGQTGSGLINTFFRACDGMEGFVGKFGESIEHTPTKEQARFIRKDYGALEYLKRVRREKENRGDFIGLAEEKRKYPITFRECFTPPPRNVFFRMDILGTRISNLQVEPEWRVGRLNWVESFGGSVEWADDPTGHWRLSKTFKKGETNRFFIDEGIWYPQGPVKYIVSADPFRVEKTEHGGMSNGGIAVFWLRDKEQDPEDKPVKQWTTHRFVMTYNFRPESTTEYAEEVLKACIWTNSPVFPENNVDLIQKKFIEWKRNGYLLYDVDLASGQLKNNPGFSTVATTKAKLFNAARDYILFHGHRCKHLDYLSECYDIPSKDAMTDYDLFTAGNGCLLGLEALGKQEFHEESLEPETGTWFPMNEY